MATTSVHDVHSPHQTAPPLVVDAAPQRGANKELWLLLSLFLIALLSNFMVDAQRMVMDLKSERIEDIRAAALLHDVEKLGISCDILFKSANFTAEEFHRFQRDMAEGKAALPPVGGSLRRVIPILLAYAESSEGRAATYQDAPLESRILAVADAYETLISGSGGMSPSEAIGSVAERGAAEFDPKVAASAIVLQLRIVI